MAFREAGDVLRHCWNPAAQNVLFMPSSTRDPSLSQVNMARFPGILTLVLLATVGCSPTDPDFEAGDVIVHGVSFGMCAGYCESVLAIDGTVVTLTESSRQSRNFPQRIRTLYLTADEAARIRQLADAEALSDVAGTHGCPDCADGGAEWIARRVDSTTIRTTYEYRLTLEPIAELQETLRALRQRFQ